MTADKTVTMTALTGQTIASKPGQLSGEELITQVMGLLGRTSTSERALVLTYLNWAQLELARVHNWNCLKIVTTGSLVADTQLYNWPSGLRTVLSFKITGDSPGKVEEAAREYVDKVNPDASTSDSTGVPMWYVWYGAVFQLFPIPDEAYDYELIFQKWPSELTDGAGSSDFDLMDDLLVYITAAHYALRVGLASDAEVYQKMVYNEYPLGSANRRGLLKMAIKNDNDRPDRVLQRREFQIYPTVKPPNYMSNPRYGL